MNRLSSLALFMLLGVIALAQDNLISIKYTVNSAEIVRFDPANLQVIGTVKSIQSDQHVVPNTFFVDEERGKAIMMTSTGNERLAMNGGGQQQILQIDLKGEQGDRVIPMNSSMMMPILINKGNKLGFISTVKSFNGYGNNDDDNSFVIFNLNTGAPKGSIKLNSISFANVQAPFLGTIEGADKNTFPGMEGSTKKVGIGSPTYIPELNEVVFCALDVMGSYRLFRLDVEAMKVKSSVALDNFVISLDYRLSDRKFVALYLDESKSAERSVRVGVLNPTTGSIEHSRLIRQLDPRETTIQSGNVTVNPATSEALISMNMYYVTMNPGEEPKLVAEGVQRLYVVNDKLEILNSQIPEKTYEKVEARFPISGERAQQFTLENSVAVYPNPALQRFNVETSEYSLANGIRVFSADYKLVKSFAVLDSALTHELDIAELAPGIYFIEIATPGGNVVKKLTVQ